MEELRVREDKEQTQGHRARNMLELEFEPKPVGFQSRTSSPSLCAPPRDLNLPVVLLCLISTQPWPILR